MAAKTYVLNDHDQEGKLDSEGLLRVERAGDVVGADVGAHDLKHGGLNIGISDTLDVAIAHILVPNLEGLRTKVQQKEKIRQTREKGIFLAAAKLWLRK